MISPILEKFDLAIAGTEDGEKYLLLALSNGLSMVCSWVKDVNKVEYMNTFSLKFVNLNSPVLGFRANTTSSQLQSYSRVMGLLIYLPAFNVILSSKGQDWLKVLEDLSTLKNKSFYRDAEDRPVEFCITFNFGYSNLSQQVKLDFIDKAQQSLVS